MLRYTSLGLLGLARICRSWAGRDTAELFEPPSEGDYPWLVMLGTSMVLAVLCFHPLRGRPRESADPPAPRRIRRRSWRRRRSG
jgi:hypothetical protein